MLFKNVFGSGIQGVRGSMKKSMGGGCATDTLQQNDGPPKRKKKTEFIRTHDHIDAIDGATRLGKRWCLARSKIGSNV